MVERSDLVTRGTVCAAVAVFSLAALAPPGNSEAAEVARAAAPTCRGVPATLVGSPDIPALAGTSGPDVIITAGSRLVSARAGSDLVCVTGSNSRVVVAGAGDDRVFTDDEAVPTEI